LSHFTIVVPEYSRRFRCTGQDCPDNCCRGWVVPIDQASIERYRSLPPGSLRSQLDAAIRMKEANDGLPDYSGVASIRMLPSGDCPFLTEERLCRIHKENGESYLSETCAQYPRQTHRIDGIAETALSLSCQEAARLVLLDPELRTSPVRRHRVDWKTSVTCTDSLRTFYWPIREFVTGLILERSYGLWQRMFLLGILCQRLDAIERGQDKRSLPEFLRDFSAVVASGALRAPMETIPANAGLQLQLVRQLIRLGAGNVEGHRSMARCLAAFNEGIDEGATAEVQLAAYSAACTSTFDPFFREHPWILENYLFNELIGWAFPFGRWFFQPEGPPEFMVSFAQLVVRFGILKGLLIGVAGARGTAFCAQDVVETAQVVSRQFEHSREFLNSSYAFLADHKLADVAGLTALLRN
jgi:lysine-N-methylase